MRESKVMRGAVCPGLACRAGEMCLTVSLAQRCPLPPFSMGTVEGACLTGGLVSIRGPPHPCGHDGAVWPCGRRLSSHAGRARMS